MTAPGPDQGPGRLQLEQQRDQALRDLLELEQQVRAGEVPPGPAQALRQRYERSAAEALVLLDGQGPVEEAGGRAGPMWRWGLYGAGAVAAVLALVVVLPPALQERPVGGFVTGNEAFDSPAATPLPAPAGRDLSKVSDEEMEAVVAANPEIVGMRLALAGRYLEQGAYDKALPHYRQVLEREPDNALALASLGWVLLQLGDATAATSFVDQALAREPTLPMAWWVQANIRLYDGQDPQGAVESLQRMQQLPLQAEVEQQVATLLAQAQARATAGAGTP